MYRIAAGYDKAIVNESRVNDSWSYDIKRGSRELRLDKRLNKLGRSLFQFRRNKSDVIDEIVLVCLYKGARFVHLSEGKDGDANRLRWIKVDLIFVGSGAADRYESCGNKRGEFQRAMSFHTLLS